MHGPDPAELERLREPGEAGAQALADVFEQHRARLARMLRRRMDPRLRTRVDPADVLQETYVEVSRRIDEYLADPRMPIFLWLRFLAMQKIVTLYRKHFEVKMRDVRRQVPMPLPPPGMTSLAVADELCASLTTPSGGAMRKEVHGAIEEALEAMSATDRDILVLRHFEDLSNVEAALELGIEPAAASKRHLRALQRLSSVLRKHGLEGALA